MDEAYKYYLQHKKEIDRETDRLFLHYQPTFAKTYLIEDGMIGCAQYLALLAYPSQRESSHRIRYFSSMVGAYCRIHDNEMLTLFHKQPKKTQEAWQIKKPWKSINQTISKGTKRLQKRLHAYHAYTAYNQAVLDGSDESFEEILSWCSSAYESKLSMMQDRKHRIENLKRTIHRPSRPIYHLLEGYFQEHLVNYPISERHPVHALTHDNWLENAIVTARRKLASELIDYHVNKLGLQKPLNLKFKPSEIVHLELASNPFVGLSC